MTAERNFALVVPVALRPARSKDELREPLTFPTSYVVDDYAPTPRAAWHAHVEFLEARFAQLVGDRR